MFRGPITYLPVPITCTGAVLLEVWDTNPGYSATGISRTTNITAEFSEEMDRATLTDSTVQLYQKYWYKVRKKKGKKVRRVWTFRWVTVNASVSCGELCSTAMLDPSSDLAAYTNYLAVITTGTKDEAGNALAQSHSWTFPTGSS